MIHSLESPSTRENPSASNLSQSTERVGDLEKEDALDILALLVERSVAFHEKTDQSSDEAHEDGSTHDECTRKGISSQLSQYQNDIIHSGITTSSQTTREKNMAESTQAECLDANSALSLSDIQDNIEDFRVISKNQSNGTIVDHATRMRALDELQRSYTYALEMKRAALSASTWLRAIGRSGKNDGDHNSAANLSTDKRISTTFNGGAHKQDLTHRYSATLSISDSVIDERIKMSPTSLRLALQSDQLLFTVKNELNKRLDHELSLCRAKIGRLKSMSRSEVSFIFSTVVTHA